jgi:hypothetical protein
MSSVPFLGVRTGTGVVACEDEHATVRARAVGVAMPERVACPVDAWTLAVPDPDNAVDAAGARHLLAPPDGGRAKLLVHTRH